MFKKIVTYLLLCSATHAALGMETAGNLMTGAVGLVRRGVIAVKEKSDPTGIFLVVHDKWPTKDNREQVTLLHKLDRGFLDGHLQEKDGDLTKLLDAIEATVPRYPICDKTLAIIHVFLGEKLPSLARRPDLLKRAVTAAYLLQPETLAPNIVNQSFTNVIADQSDREAIIGSVVKTLIERENAKEANILVQTLAGKSDVVPLGTHAQRTLKDFLSAVAVSSLRSCEYIDSLGNTNVDDPVNAELKRGSQRIKQLKARITAVQDANKAEEDKLQKEYVVLEKRRVELAEIKKQYDLIQIEDAARAQELERQKAVLALRRSEIDQAEQILAQELEAAEIAKAAAILLVAEAQAAAQLVAAPAPQQPLQQSPAAAPKSAAKGKNPLKSSADSSQGQSPKTSINNSNNK